MRVDWEEQGLMLLLLQIGQVTEDDLELREVRVASDKLYSMPFWST